MRDTGSLHVRLKIFGRSIRTAVVRKIICFGFDAVAKLKNHKKHRASPGPRYNRHGRLPATH